MITGSRCPERSWEKCTVWILSNGWTAWEQYSYYGPYLSSLEAPDGKHWQASNGSPGDQSSIGGAAKANAAFSTDEYIDLPEFAIPWRDTDRHKLVRPKFTKEDTRYTRGATHG